jgi:hypothetical protein
MCDCFSGNVTGNCTNAYCETFQEAGLLTRAGTFNRDWNRSHLIRGMLSRTCFRVGLFPGRQVK